MKIKDILAKKAPHVFTIRPDLSCKETIQILVENNVGALFVTDDNDMLVGIVTERDILKTCSTCTSGCETVMRLPVSEIMSRNLIIGVQDDDIDQAMGVMSQNGIRHLPIMDGEKICGMISIRDLVDARLEETTYEVRYLKDYISGSLT